jgi:hypothetical protein
MPPFSHSFNGQLTSKRVPIYFLSTLIHRNIEEKLTLKLFWMGRIADGWPAPLLSFPSKITVWKSPSDRKVRKRWAMVRMVACTQNGLEAEKGLNQ